MRKVIITLSVCLLVILSLVAGQPPFPTVGVATIAVKEGKVLVSKTGHTVPIKHLALGDSPKQCALKTLRRFSGLIAHESSNIFWTTDVCDPMSGHYITVYVVVDTFDGKENLDNCEWVDIHQLPGSILTAVKGLDSIRLLS